MKKEETGQKENNSDRMLLISVFITGACVLAIEVLANRILSPYFGNTIYSVSSILGVVLTALSFGYYYGGKIADRYPRGNLFYFIIFAAGLSVLFIKIVSSFILQPLANNLGIISGPVIASFILFLIPSFLLGILSPFAVTLHSLKAKKTSIGKVSGEVFFYSTLGSIAGSFISGFYLIPRFGVGNIIIGTSLVLIILSLTGLYIGKNKINLKKILLTYLFFILFSLISQENYLKNVLYIKDGIYEKIIVLDSSNSAEKKRYLFLDRSASSAIYLDKKDELAFAYSRYIDFPKYLNVKPSSYLFIGGGAYSMPKYIYDKNNTADIDVSEIEPSLYVLAKKYFYLNENSSIDNHVIDGRLYLNKNDKKYDLIFSDVYSSVYSIPVQFTTKEYFEKVSERLNDKGFALLNVISDEYREKPSLLFSEIKTFSSVFPDYLVFKVKTESKTVNNFVIIGFKGFDKNEYLSLKNKFSEGGLYVNKEDKLLSIGENELNDQILLTDNYAPVEYLTAQLLGRSGI